MTPESPETPTLFRESRALRIVGPGVYSVLPESTAAAYDRKARLYDAIVGWPPYHRVVWGTSAARYTEFARSALAAAGNSSFAEIGCGSLLFTAAMYHEQRFARIIVTDRSLGMLRRASTRLASASNPLPGQLVVLHADAADLPLASHAFSSVLMLNLLHVPCDRAAIVAECARLLTPGRGRMFATCLVRSGRWSDAVMFLFHHIGELGTPLAPDEALELMAGGWGRVESCRVEGNMAFVVVEHGG